MIAINQLTDKDMYSCKGTVTKVLPGNFYLVLINDNFEVKAHIAGRIRTSHHARIFAGDKVIVEISKHDITNGRIVKKILSPSQYQTVLTNAQKHKKTHHK